RGPVKRPPVCRPTGIRRAGALDRVAQADEDSRAGGGSRMKLFTAGVATESNTFAPMPTGLDDYTGFRGAPPEDRPTSFPQPVLAWRRLAAARGFTVVGSLGAVAPPAGPTVRGVWEAFPRRDPRRSPARDAGRRRAPESPRGDGGRRLRRLRRGHSGPRPPDRRAIGAGGCGARPALPRHAADGRAGNGPRALQGVPAHGLRGARRGPLRARRGRGGAAHAAAHGSLGLPHDRQLLHD